MYYTYVSYKMAMSL